MIPRPYQERALSDALDYAAEHPNGKLLVCAPPGAGKTLIEALLLKLMAEGQGLRGLAWAHRRELAFQAYDHLIECGVPRELIGIMVSGDAGHEREDADRPARRRAPTAPIQVATIGMLRSVDVEADVVISDEAHMDAADGRRKLRARYPRAFHVGFTGTPCRLDGRGLSKEYDEILIVSTVTELIALGHLAEPAVWTVPKELLPDLSGVRRKMGDFEVGALDKAVRRRAIIGGIVEHWARHAEGLRTFAFAVTREHSRQIAAAFRAAGIPWEHIDGETTVDERRRLLDRVTGGDLMGLSCADLLTTGVDRPPIKCVIQARPTLSLGLHLQQCGRPMRPWNGVRPVILDHAGNAMRRGLGLPQEERDWRTLFHAETRPRAPRPTARECVACHAIMPVKIAACRQCSTTFPVRDTPGISPEKDGKLVRASASEEERARAWETIQKVAREVGADEAWAAKVYEARFGEPRRVA